MDKLQEILQKHPLESVYSKDCLAYLKKEKPDVYDAESKLEIMNQDTGKPVWIRAYGPIVPWGVNSKSLMDTLNEVDETRDLVIRIQSPGGLAYEGLALYSVLSQWQGKVTTRADGLVASAGSLFFMGGDERLVPEKSGSLIMFHYAWTIRIMMGNAATLGPLMKKTIGSLQAYDEEILDILTSLPNVSRVQAEEMMDSDEYLRSKKALKLGIATGTFTKKDKSKSGTVPGEKLMNSVEWGQGVFNAVHN